jgi:hypothetical protein
MTINEPVTEADAAEPGECEPNQSDQSSLFATLAGRFQQASGAVADRSGVFMESLETTILNTAVPTIVAALHVAPLSIKSVLASYST